MSSKYSSVHYTDYLQLDKVLNAQHLRSAEFGNAAHDEMLFIVIHQVYELWFKQILHELEAVRAEFMNEVIDERSVFNAVSRLERVTEIQELLIQQIAVLETMAPLDFLDFRNYLFPASGFQSFQFRKIEVLLGLKEEDRITYNGKPYHIVFDEDQKNLLHQIRDEGSILDWLERWLERIPFLKIEDFSFVDQYKAAVLRMHNNQRKAIEENPILEKDNKQARLQMIEKTEEYFFQLLDPVHLETLRKEGKWRLSYRATLACLLVKLYKEEPILHMPNLLLDKILDVDELFNNWRHRHSQMVLRMLGRKTGTGGSSGYDYLKKTISKHQVFNDIHAISTLLIPRSELPPLPPRLKRQLGFYFTEIDN